MFTPRDYQIKSHDRVVEVVNRGGHPLIILATGTGKTEVAGMLTKTFNAEGKTVLFLAHRGFLLDQADTKLFKHTKDYPMREQGKIRANWGYGNITATIQTLKGNRLANINPNSVDIIIVDECHRSTSNTYQNIFNHFSSALRIGLTATGDRPDSKSLYPTFSEIAMQYSLSEAIRAGYLSRIIGRKVDGFNIDLNGLKVSDGDFSSEEEIGNVIEKYLTPIAENIEKETLERKKVLLFMPNVHSSKLMSETMNGLGMDADYVAGERDDNNDVLSRFRSGEIKYLCSRDLLIEGYDEPEIDCVVMLRPTGSRIVFSQAVGRGTRLAEGKEDLLLLEFTYNSDNLSLVTAYELLADSFDQGMIEEAKKRSSNDDEDFLESLDEIERTYYSMDSILKRAASVDYEFNTFNPIDLGEMLEINNDVESWFSGHLLVGEITHKQKELLDRYMIDTTGMTKATASKVIDKLHSANVYPSKGQVSDAQLKYLSSLYKTKIPSGLTKAAAGLLIKAKKGDLNL